MRNFTRWYIFGGNDSLPDCVAYGSIRFITESNTPVQITFAIKSNYDVESIAMLLNHDRYRLSYNTKGIFTLRFDHSKNYSMNDTAIRANNDQMVIVANILKDAFNV